MFKHRRPAVSGVVDTEPRRVIRWIAAQRRCPLRELGVDFAFDAIAPEGSLERPSPGQVRVKTWRTPWETLKLSLMGFHQAHNAAVALAGLDLLAEVEPSLEVGRAAAARGIAGLRCPARVEVMGESPWLVIDGRTMLRRPRRSSRRFSITSPRPRAALVFGTTRDKDLAGQLRALLPLFRPRDRHALH